VLTKAQWYSTLFIGRYSRLFTFAPRNTPILPKVNKRKILNDPIYGFVSLPDDLICDLIDHPYFQRLRRIKQLGLSHLVYPGALHTRFHHAIGAMHLMMSALDVLGQKGVSISKEEQLGAAIAILLHDIGHGPFSHALEHSLVDGVNHEDLSVLIMNRLNEEFNGQLTVGIAIFNNTYPKKWLHQLVSGQLDMDRMDYLKRDSFYTGVSEGVISNARILKMLAVANDELVIEEKGIYSIEKFLVARRLMYWQVYLHKTVVSAEFMLVKCLQRAKELAVNGTEMFASPALAFFLKNKVSKEDFVSNPKMIDQFTQLDDSDIMGAMKVWCNHPDKVLSALSQGLVNRKLFRIELQDKPFDRNYCSYLQEKVMVQMGYTRQEASYFVISDKLMNNAYSPSVGRIAILNKKGDLTDIAQASDSLNISAMSGMVTKHFVCYPKGVEN